MIPSLGFQHQDLNYCAAYINKLASTIANIVQPMQYTPIATDQLALTGLL